MPRVLSVSILVAVTFWSSTAAGQLPDFPFIFAQGEATVEVAPDKAIVSFRIEAFETESSAALQKVTDRTSQLLRLCQRHGVPSTDIMAYEIGKRAVRKESAGYQKLGIIGYEVTREFNITLRHLDHYGAFMSELVAMENVTSPSSSFDVVAREKLESDLMAKACTRARERAEFMARGSGSKLGAIFALSSTGFSNLSGAFGFSYGAYGAGEGTAVEPPTLLLPPTTIKITKSVDAIYRLEPR